MMLGSSILLLLALLWAGLQLAAARGLEKVLQPPFSHCRERYPRVSVIVPARNEEHNIEECLQRILANTYPADRFEVIVADDGSMDDTAKIAKGFLQNAQVQGEVLTVSEGEASGSKPRAVRRGIEYASGDIVLTTDADCRVGRGWIFNMVTCFDEQTELVAGPVTFSPLRSVFDRLQAVEFLGLIGFGAGTIGMGKGTICNSANLAYRREAYLRLQDDNEQPAADELLLQNLSQEESKSVRFCHQPGAVVTTPPAASISSFWQQRVRWASMGTQYPSPYAVAVAVLAWLFHLLLIAGSVLAVLGLMPLWAPLLAWILKIGSDARLILPLLRHIDQERLFRYFLPAEVLHPLYVAAIGVGGTFGSFSWKE